MRLAGLVLGALSLALMLWLAWHDFAAVDAGPGALHPAHAAVAALQGAAGCAGCHEPGVGVTAAKCVRCHTAIGEQGTTNRGLHGALAADGHAGCAACHGEHHGTATPLLPPHAYEQAGVSLDHYDHRHTPGFRLAGAHADLACARCHPAAHADAPPPGGRFLGLDQGCTSCHQDPHRQAFGGDCEHCHGQAEPWRAAPGLPHRRFGLGGGHAGIACSVCHPEGSAASVAAERAAELPVRACRACHVDPHAPGGAALQFAAAEHCERCHTTASFRKASWEPAQHAAKFALRGAHATAACSACHGGGAGQVRWRGDAPPLAECAACHQHPHRPAVVAAADCAACHDDRRPDWQAQLDPVRHAAFAMPLLAPHAAVACQACHRGGTYAERYPGREASDCRACHADVHGGQFALAGRSRQCTDCHLATAFVPAQFGIEAHASTALPLVGAHEAVACASCHREVRPDCGRRFRGTSTVCSDCHADPHRGAFDRPGLPGRASAGPQQVGCARCHSTAAFAPVPDFDHALWTGYELVAAHAKVACARCHPRPAGGGPRLGPVRGRACADCHADPHAGQFATAGQQDCARCHEVTTFATVHVDHAATRFPLDAVHAAVACSRCHRAAAYPDGSVAVRYRPLGTLCGDCHLVGGGRR